MKVAILSDIHGNLEALTEVCAQIGDTDGIILLGDIIDYCQHSNEVISILRMINEKVICNIWGNHEEMILNDDYSSFDLERGVICARHTKKQLTAASVDYLNNYMMHAGISKFEIGGKRILAVHGSMADNYWQPIEAGQNLSAYSDFDYVLSGHSHIPHLFEINYPYDDPKRRNRKKTVFINPGSVGQPRNHSPFSQYAVLDTDTEEVTFRKVEYDIRKEQEAFSNEIDDFYRIRLEYGV